uniref:Peptidyl-prolyl isomerase n=1 Tax=uncultured marine thaumarchaeote KM3_79_E03 TaxID=1456296 RepID=A0A075HN93_9ARCH|nr:peptidyl-prolyl isomerase [uncultured marine thaumarchaeote KM3_79_E03]
MKYLFLSVLVVSLVGVLVIPDVFPQAADKTYTNQKYDFSLQYPANWKVSELHLVDKASNSEIIVELTSPEYEAAGCINGQCGEGLWYGEDRILITRDILPNNPYYVGKPQLAYDPDGDITETIGGVEYSLSETGNITYDLDGTAALMFDGISSACKQTTYQNSGQICKNPKLMDYSIIDTWEPDPDFPYNTVTKIVATSTNLHKEGLEYSPLYITIAWYDNVDQHNWQFTIFLADFRNSNGYGNMGLLTSDIVFGITDSLTFDRPNDYSPPEASEATGGCLIATAAFGSEMAPQVQFLRELRDNTVLQTESGTSFMAGFNQFYYSFSPAIADYERENPVFKEVVKITLTPLLTSLTLLQYADIDSESEMLGYGISVILLNIGMYFVAPAVLIMKIRKRI